MTTIAVQHNYSPSINIKRDANHLLDYVVTPNAHRTYEQILDNYSLGLRSFSIIGSYGTGKSAFLVALEQTLSGKRYHFPFPNGHFPNVSGFKFINVVGSYASLVDSLTLALSAPNPDLVWHYLERAQIEAEQTQSCLVIVIDEFGKFLEYAAQTNPERELYFIQQLAEFANDLSKNVLFIAVLHQSFFAYAAGLTRKQQDEWEKVKGRLKELTFNEPVEQLLELAATVMRQDRTPNNPSSLSYLIDAIETSRAFPHVRQLDIDFAARLLPLDLLAASVLTHALQSYGQNERSLFTFLRANEYLGLQQFDSTRHPYYNLACVYDYLLNNYYSLLSTIHNPHYASWGAMRHAVERTEHSVEQNVVDALKLVKTIGLLNIFSGKGARINERFLMQYGRLALGIPDLAPILRELEDRKIIRYVNYRETYVLFEGTDLDIDHALYEAASFVDPVASVVHELSRYFDFPYILAKDVSYQTGTPRFVAFQLTEAPTNTLPESAVDGLINLIFDEALTLPDLLSYSADNRTNVLFGLYQHTRRIRDLLFELRKIEHVIHTNQNDRVAVRELTALKHNQVAQLNLAVMSSLYANNGNIAWVWDGKTIKIDSPRSFNRQLSTLCRISYPQTPIYRNELINRQNLSSAIATARRNFVRALVGHSQSADLAFSPSQYPPEKSIYLTLLKDTGVHREADGEYLLEAPTDASFLPLWQHGEQFLESTKATPRPLTELIEAWLARPFKLKQGFIDFWLPTFLFAKRETFALYHEGRYISSLSVETFDLIYREPHKFRIKSFAVDGVRLRIFNRCRAFLQQGLSDSISSSSFIETIKPFLVFYSSLPDYAKTTQRLDPATLRLRDAISRAIDPERAFFEEFPQALGFADLHREDVTDSELDQYIQQLRRSVHELQGCYDNVVDRVEHQLCDVFGLGKLDFADYKPAIAIRYHALHVHLLLPQQKSLYLRLTSALDDRTAWLNSVVQAILGKTIASMRDDDELVIFDRLRSAVHALDNLTDLSMVSADDPTNAVKVEITKPSQASQQRVFRLPKANESDVADMYKNLEAQLGNDSTVNLNALLRLLEKVMHED